MVCAYRLHQDFTVVSVLEKLEMGLEVLECLLPSYFKVLDGPKKKLQKTTTFRGWSIFRPKFLSTSTPTIKVKQPLPQKRFTPFNLQVNSKILILKKNPVIFHRYFQYWKMLWSLSRYYIPQHWQGKFGRFSDKKCSILMSLLLFLPCWIIQFCNVQDNLLPYRLREQKKACMDGKGWRRMALQRSNKQCRAMLS